MNPKPDHPIRSSDIAIIGMAGRFPGARNVREFWQNLVEAKESITFFSAEELVREGIPPAVVHHPDYVKASPILPDIDRFDAAFFGYSPREAEAMDPQHRLLLECAWATLEDGGYAPDSYQGAIGVYAGSGGSISSYLLAYLDHNPSVRGATGSYHHLGNDKDFLTTRISYKLNLSGPSIAVQTACSTSLVAVHLACQSLLSGECDMALAGGVSVRVPHKVGYFWEKGSIFSRDGHLRAFDAQAQGTIFGSGLGLVLLKPLDNALADRDSIYAVIKGSALNNDGGEKTSYMATKLAGQVNCMLEALAVAEVEPETLSFIETHGTGTAMGDPVEVKALAQAFRTSTDKKGFCGLGSVKNNVGHLDTSAGITSLIKVALSLKHKLLPPTINFATPNPRIDFENSPFYIDTELRAWDHPVGPRRAGVNGLGIGGTNAFVILEEAPGEPAERREPARPYYLIALSAKNSAALQRRLTDLSLWLDEEAGQAPCLQDIAYTLQLGRSHFPVRCGLVIKDIDDLKHNLKLIQNGESVEEYLYYNEGTAPSPEQRPALKQFGAFLLEEITTRNDVSEATYREKLLALADLFVQGYELAWPDLYAAETCQRISLPTYPFEKKRYWIPPKDKSLKTDLAPLRSPSNPVVIKPRPNNRATPVSEEIGPHPLRKLLQTDLAQMMADLLKIEAEEFSEDEILDDYGFDSITFIALTNWLNETYTLELMPTLFFEYNTLGLLCSYLWQNHGDGLAQYYRRSTHLNLEPAITSVGSAPGLFLQPLTSDHQPPIEQTAPKWVMGQVAIDPVTDSIPQAPAEAIAIIGMSGVLPGSPDLDSFWQHLVDGDDLITEVPADRWDWRALYGDPRTQINKTNVKWGGFIADVDKFDATFFRISPREAKLMDPQQRIFLETAWKCIEDAGYRASSLSGTHTGIFVGVSTGDYQDLLQNDQVQVQAHLSTGLNRSVLANRVSFLLNLHGPSESIDTACSSSLVALQRAVQALQAGACEMALVGGVNALLSPQLYISFSQAGMLCEDGRCKTFDRRANGYVRGEGVGAIFLKPLRRAEADGDHIYAVIKASAENHGGRTNSLTAPNPKAQANLLVKAYQQAAIDPATVSYIEAHGTGTALGDPIEINGLKQAFERLYHQWPNERPVSPHCGLGSVKSNIGHLEAAAGIAGVLKVLLALKHKQLPATINFEQQNPYIDLTDSPFYLVTETRPWQALSDENGRPIPRRAGVSSFGFGGANVHVVLEEYQGVGIRGQGLGGRDQGVGIRGQGSGGRDQGVVVRNQVEREEGRLIVLSARDEERLRLYAGKMLDFVERHLDASSRDQTTLLADLAYTLQTGREALECRLALVAARLEEVRTRLKPYLANENDPDGIYVGTLKSTKHRLDLSLEVDEAPEVVGEAADHGDLATLARRWVEGSSIDWRSLYEPPLPNRISLPTYPFARERHWIPKYERRLINDETFSSFSILHSSFQWPPLLHRNTSTFTEQQFSSTLTGEEFFLKDHRVRGEKTLPGVAYLEMARAAAEIAGNQPVVQFRNMIWASPIVVKDQPADIQVRLYPNDTGEVSYEISRTDGDNHPTIHAQGKLNFGHQVSLGDAPLIDLKAIRERCTEKLSPKECYTQFRQKGLEYGPNFQPIVAITGNSREALARLRLPVHLREEKNAYGLHPSLMDGALQTIIGIKLSQLNGADAKLYLPFAAQEVRLYGPLPDEAYAYVTYSHAGTGATGLPNPEAAIAKYDIAVTDEQGQARLFFKELTVRAVPAQPKPETDSKESRPIYCTPTWQVKTIAQRDGEPENIDHVNLLLMVAGLPPSLVKTIGAGFKQAKLIELAPEPGSDIAGQVTALTLTMWDQLKAIAEKRPGTQTRIVVLALATDQPYLYAPLAGLLKTARLEHPKIQGKAVTVVNPVAGSLMAILSHEIRPETFDEVEVRYDAIGTRQVKSLKAIELASDEQRWAYLKPGGVYWITGGLGGLGQIFARHLAEYGQGITVILSGRSPLDDAGRARLAKLSQPGVTIDYLQADVSQQEDVEQVVQSIKMHYGPLNGIIHSAGVIRDSYILKKTVTEIEAVLAPKVAGTVNIDIATQAEALDFLILFSSVSGVMGNMGQSIYAAANAFMDEYAHHRQALVEARPRSGRTLSINWPLWAEGGMAVDEQSRILMTQLTGMTPLPTATGLRAFERLMASTEPQVLVAVGAVDRLRRSLLSGGAGRSNLTPAVESVPHDTPWLAEKIQADLIRIVSELLMIKVEDISGDEPLSEYGFDSFTLTELTYKLNQTYQLELMPTVFFEYNTLAAVSHYLAEYYPGHLGPYDPVKSAVSLASSSLTTLPPQPVVGARFPSPSEADQKEPGRQGAQPEAIAIIGMSGVLPGSPDLDAFWQHLSAGKDLIGEIPPDRWDWRTYTGDPHSEANKTPLKWGGFIADVDKFDATFFKISPREAELMDPQQRLWLQTVWHCIEDAGYAPSQLAGTRTGIFVGVASDDYQVLLRTHLSDSGPHSATGLSHSVLANRVSFLLDLHGPSEPIDTACSSSLVAIHRAVEALRSGSCELAIAGGVNVLLAPHLYLAFSQAGMLAEDGRCKTFDRQANGYVRAEGVGAIFLKPLTQAEANGDPIYAVIRGTAVNHGGQATSLTAPNPKAQADLLVSAYQQANLDPATVSYIEAHGTGTALGDPIEINGLKQAFARLYQHWQHASPARPHCGLGSVKTNIGHLETAAGIAGVLKVLLALKHQTLPASLHFEDQNPYIDLKESPFYLVTETQAWQPLADEAGQPLPRRAGVSSFGFGGANAHVVLEEYQAAAERGRREGPQLIVLSAKNEARLRESAAKLLFYLEQASNSTLTEPKLAIEKSLPAIASVVRAMVAEMIGVDPDNIEVEHPLAGYGLDAVHLSRLKTMAEERYQCDLPIALFSGEASVEHVAQHLAAPQAADERNNQTTPQPALSLGSIAYTLQVGREAMEARLALVVEDIVTLREKLMAYLAGQATIGQCYWGQVKQNQASLRLLDDDEDSRTLIRQWIAKGKLDKLAAGWVAGLTVEWSLLYGAEKPGRISLPTYPFAKERYWLPLAPGNETGRPTSAGLAPIAEPIASRQMVLLAKAWETAEPSPERQVDTGRVAILTTDKTRSLAEALAVELAKAVCLMPLQISQVMAAEANAGSDFSGCIDLTGLDASYSVEQEAAGLRWLQHLIEPSGQGRLHLLYVTSRLETYQNNRVQLGGARRAALYRLLTSECGHVRSRHLDTDLSIADTERMVTQILTEWPQDDEAVEICYRMGRRYRATLQEIEGEAAIQAAARTATGYPAEQVLWITGGARGLGMACAQHFVKRHGVRKLVLLGRQTIPQREAWEKCLSNPATEPALKQKLEDIRALEAAGAEVMVLAGSLTDKAELLRHKEIVNQKMGAIFGVIHCAGVVSRKNPAFIRKEMAEIEQVAAPKVSGLSTLHQVLASEPLQFFVLFSSVSAVSPRLGVGQSDYAMANSYLDYFAGYQHSQGQRHYISLQWPNWQESGMGLVTSEVYRNSGLLSLTNKEGLTLLDAVLALKPGPVVLPAVGQASSFQPARLLRPRPELRPITASGSLATNGSSPLADKTVTWFKGVLSQELKLPEDRLELDLAFQEYGVDSILLVQLVARIERELPGMKLDPSVILAYPTIKHLTGYLVEAYPQALGAVLSEAAPAAGLVDTSKGRGNPEAELGPRRPKPSVRAIQMPSSGDGSAQIAVVGLACHFPDAPDSKQFWANLSTGQDSVRDVPRSRWDINHYYDPQSYQAGKSISKWGAFLAGIENFDPTYFGITETLAPHIDPLARQWLEVSVEALADAGYGQRDLWGQPVGVFVGSRVGNFAGKLTAPHKEAIVGLGQNFIAAHLAHLYNFKGPNMVVDTACASSLTAIHLACESLKRSESTVALAGGVDILLDEAPYLALSVAQVLSPDGRCKTFDEKANGIGLGEGCGVLVLKPLEQALADGNKIYGVIEGTAINQDGATMGITTPNPAAQQALIETVLDAARVNPRTITYVETHGTGTLIGDPIELRGLTNAFKQDNSGKQFCGVGSVKSNVGHLLSAAGAAGLIKVLLSITHQQLPPTLHCERPNPRFNFAESPFYPVQQLTEWVGEAGIHRAGVSAFGLGGHNAHLIVSDEGIPASHRADLEPRGEPVVFNRKRYWPTGQPLPTANNGSAEPVVDDERDHLKEKFKRFFEEEFEIIAQEQPL